jgi:hypothetical protein
LRAISAAQVAAINVRCEEDLLEMFKMWGGRLRKWRALPRKVPRSVGGSKMFADEVASAYEYGRRRGVLMTRDVDGYSSGCLLAVFVV